MAALGLIASKLDERQRACLLAAYNEDQVRETTHIGLGDPPASAHCLTGRYGPGVLDQNLGALLAEWVAAQGSNFLVKGGKLKKVSAQFQPYADGPLPPDPGPDLTGLIDLAKHVKAGCLEELILARLGLPWDRTKRP